MLNKCALILLSLATLFYANKSDSLISDTRNQIAEINIFLYSNNYPNAKQLSKLKLSIQNLAKSNPKQILNSIKSSKNISEELNRLAGSLEAFELLLESKPQIDSLIKVFRVVNNNFNSTFGNYFYKELLKSTKQKVLIFSTSMSCECTLEICCKQEAEIQKLCKENPAVFDYAVVDCFTNFDLQNKYDVGFIPTVIVMDTKNNEIKRFLREENITNKLTFLKED